MENITAAEVRKRIEAGENLHLVDVREPAENAEFNIGGKLVPLGKIKTMDVEELEPWKEEEVICYCRSGARSGQACQVLESMGFTNTKNLVGGMMGWQQ